MPTALFITGWLSDTILPTITPSEIEKVAASMAIIPPIGRIRPDGPTVIHTMPASAMNAPTSALRFSDSNP